MPLPCSLATLGTNLTSSRPCGPDVGMTVGGFRWTHTTRAGLGGERGGEHRLAGPRRPVDQHALRRRDAPPLVELRSRERRREAAHDLLRLREAADLIEGRVGLDLDLDASGQIAELLAEL